MNTLSLGTITCSNEVMHGSLKSLLIKTEVCCLCQFTDFGMLQNVACVKGD
jgi:hypothetical protein